jgi:hypothetical protein
VRFPIRVIEGKLVPKSRRMIVMLEVGKFMKQNMTKLRQREKDNLPVKTKIAESRTRSKTGFRITNRNLMIVKIELRPEKR